eukprot:SAG11_NODE_6402_length_1321_cov_1.032733_1_plen_90_part_00
MLEHDFEVDFAGEGGATALHFATQANDLPLILLLLAYGASPALRDATGESAITFAQHVSLHRACWCHCICVRPLVAAAAHGTLSPPVAL